ncbi:MAG: hypothetical protein DME18_09295 [Verrucomicrobia bacterium]|nr:MAG: hypothetical protein DME18_09295 [Verrucomicrobiota bacterium]
MGANDRRSRKGSRQTKGRTDYVSGEAGRRGAARRQPAITRCRHRAFYLQCQFSEAGNGARRKRPEFRSNDVTASNETKHTLVFARQAISVMRFSVR